MTNVSGAPIARQEAEGDLESVVVHPSEPVITSLKSNESHPPPPSPSSMTSLATPPAPAAPISIYNGSQQQPTSIVQPSQRSYPFLFQTHHQPIYITESEKLRKIRQRKERKESRRGNKFIEYKTDSNVDRPYDLEEVLGSLGEKNNENNKKSSNNKNNNNSSGGNHVKLSKSNSSSKSRRRSNGGGNSVSSSNKQNGVASTTVTTSSSEEKDEENSDEETTSTNNKLNNNLNNNPSIINNEFIGAHHQQHLEDELLMDVEKRSKSSENLCFTKVTNKKANRKKKTSPPQQQNSTNNSKSASAANNVNNSTTAHTNNANASDRSSSVFNGYNLRNRDISKSEQPSRSSPPPPPSPTVDLNTQEFPPLNLSSGGGGPAANGSEGGDTASSSSSSSNGGTTWPSSVGSTTKANSVNSDYEPPSMQAVINNVSGVSGGAPPDITVVHNNSPSTSNLPDITNHVATTAGNGTSTGESTPVRLDDDSFSSSHNVEIVETEEEYIKHSVEASAPVVILAGRGQDWSSTEETASMVEFGFDLNPELLAMSSSSVSTTVNPPPQPPPAKATLDSEDNAILSFGDLLVGSHHGISSESGISSSNTSPITTASQDLPPPPYNYNEIFALVSASWYQIEKELKRKPQHVRYYRADITTV